MYTWYMHKKLGLLYVALLTVTLYPVEPVYYCPGQSSNTISSGALKFYFGFKKFMSGPLESCDFVDPQRCSWISTYQTQKNIDNIKLNIVKFNRQRDRNIFIPTVYWI